METKYKQPKLKDSFYGEMFWQDFDNDSETHWFARIENVPNEKFEVSIEAESSLDFMAVRNTYSTSKHTTVRRSLLKSKYDK